MKFYNTIARFTGTQKNITQNSTIPERVPHAEKYNTKLHNTRARSKRRKIQHKISQYHSALHMQKIYTTTLHKFHNNRSLIQQENIRRLLTSSNTRLLSTFLSKKKQFHTRRKIQHAYNMSIQHAYNTEFIQHVKYNLSWDFLAQIQRHCAVPRVKVQKGTTEIGRTSSLIRHMYILIYIVMRTNLYIVMHTSRIIF